MTKVIYLEPADFVGGAELFSVDILNCLPADTSLLLLTGDKSGKFSLQRKNLDTQDFVFPRLRPFRFIEFVKTVKKLRTIGKVENAILIHSNSVRSGILAAFSGIPFTHFAHDFTTPRFLAPVLNRALTICCCSEAVKNDLIIKGIPARKLIVIPNGISLAPSSVNCRFITSAPNIAIVGRIDSWKGQDVFIDAAAQLHPLFPQAKFLIFGEPSAHDAKTVAFTEQLKARVKAEKMDYVAFHGFVPAAEIYPQIDILVHASTQPEPFGRTILEALNFGIPVIATNAGGVTEILTGRLSEFLVAPSSAEAIAQKLIRIIRTPTLQAEFKIAAEDRIKDFELSKIANRFFSVWKEAMKKNSYQK